MNSNWNSNYRILRASSDRGRYWFEKIIVEIHLLETYSLGGKINEIHKYFTQNSQGLISVGKPDAATTEPYLAHRVAENGAVCKREPENSSADGAEKNLGARMYNLSTSTSQLRWESPSPCPCTSLKLQSTLLSSRWL